MAKTCHTQRDLHQDMCEVCGAEYGPDVQMQLGKKLMPRPLASRWQCVARTEDYLIKTGYQFRSVLRFVLTTIALKKKPSTPSTLRPVLDELNADEIEAYKQKMGRWRRDVLVALEDSCLIHLGLIFEV